jgi:hypothetical protein
MVTSGPNLLELNYHENASVMINGMVPIPAVLDYQVDYITIQYMIKQMNATIKRLKYIIFYQNNKLTWYEIYLASFVLLCCLETVHARQVEILQRWSSEVRRFPYLSEHMLT